MTKIIVPNHRYDLPDSSDSDILDHQMIEIDKRDLPKIIASWEAVKKFQNVNVDIKKLFTKSAKSYCEYAAKKHALGPYLLRPHITIHCGAKEGAEHCRQAAHDMMYQTGRLTALNGFNLWYGGGDKGLMGSAMRGFIDARAELAAKGQAFPDQYVLQVIPAMFVKGVVSKNGMRPANEGLCEDTDVAIIMPDFMTRRGLLGSKCAAAIAGLGGIGTADELTDMLVHIKTGLSSIACYAVDMYVDRLKHGYWDNFRKWIGDAVECGYESDIIFKHVQFMPEPKAVFEDLLGKLNPVGQNPYNVYEKNKAAYEARQMKISSEAKSEPSPPIKRRNQEWRRWLPWPGR